MPTPIVSSASATWNGDLLSGSGTTTLESSGAGSFPVTWKARAEEHGGLTSPEELIAAAHATCLSMQFAHFLAENGTPATQLDTKANATFVVGSGITGIHLTVHGQVNGIDAETFERLAQDAKANCPVSQALTGTEITLTATLA